MSKLLADAVRKEVVNDLFSTKTFNNSFTVWGPKIRGILGNSPDADHIFGLSRELRDIFISTGGAGRGQQELSGGGAAWEGLVCYYLNLALAGTHAVVLKKKSAIPLAVRSALTVSHRNTQTNTESDLVCITLPDIDACDLEQLPLFKGEKLVDRMDQVVKTNQADTSVLVVQCKTNWNDNAQIPMLWDMVYRAQGFSEDSRITVGKDGYSLGDFKSFQYAFATVPSNKIDLFKPTSLSVKRVSELSGGNYWGLETKSGIAKQLSELLSRTHLPSGSIRAHIDRNQPALLSEHAYFSLYS